MSDTAGDVRSTAEPLLIKLFRWGTKGALAVIDQGLIAGSNFILSILLARWLEPAEYGGYAVVFSAFLLIANAYQAMLLSPYLVLGSTVYAGRRSQYLGAMMRFHILASVVMSCLMLVPAVYCLLTGRGTSLAGAFAGAALALPCVLLYWIARSAHYVELSPEASALGAVCYASVLIAALYALRYFGLITAFMGFVATAAASLVLGVFLLQRLGLDYRTGADSIPLSELWRESWVYGRWELAISLVTWLPANLCYSVTAAALDASYAGGLRALQNIALPLGHTFGACLRLAIPYVCRLYDREGLKAVNKAVKGLTAGALLVSAGYTGVAVLLGDLPMYWLYDGKFLEFSSMVPLLLLTTFFWSGLEAVGTGLRAMRYPRGVFISYLAAATTYLVTGYPLTVLLGFPGSIMSLVATYAVAFFIGIRVYRIQIKDQSKPVPEEVQYQEIAS